MLRHIKLVTSSTLILLNCFLWLGFCLSPSNASKPILLFVSFRFLSIRCSHASENRMKFRGIDESVESYILLSYIAEDQPREVAGAVEEEVVEV